MLIYIYIGIQYLYWYSKLLLIFKTFIDIQNFYSEMNSTNAELINDVLSLVLEIIYISASIVMIGVAGIASGLTLSFFAQDVTRLEILQRVSPSSTIRARVSIILRLLQHRHRLLITLIVTNMI